MFVSRRTCTRGPCHAVPADREQKRASTVLAMQVPMKGPVDWPRVTHWGLGGETLERAVASRVDAVAERSSASADSAVATARCKKAIVSQ